MGTAEHLTPSAGQMGPTALHESPVLTAGEEDIAHCLGVLGPPWEQREIGPYSNERVRRPGSHGRCDGLQRIILWAGRKVKSILRDEQK